MPATPNPVLIPSPGSPSLASPKPAERLVYDRQSANWAGCASQDFPQPLKSERENAFVVAVLEKGKKKKKLCIKSERQSIGGHWAGSLGSRYFPISVFQLYLKDIRTSMVTVCSSSYIFSPHWITFTALLHFYIATLMGQNLFHWSTFLF